MDVTPEGNDVIDFECNLAKVESLEEWFQEEYSEDGKCRPCQLQPLASLYLKVLEEGGEVEQAKTLSDVYEEGDLLTIAKTMDTIKNSARSDIKQNLETLDCMVQSPSDEMEDEEE